LIEALLTRVSFPTASGPRAARIACPGCPAGPGRRACHGHPAAGPGHPPRDVSATQPLHLRVHALRAARRARPSQRGDPAWLPATARQARWPTLGASRISRDCVVNYSLTDPGAFICPRSWDCARPCVNISALPLQGYTLQGHGLKFSPPWSSVPGEILPAKLGQPAQTSARSTTAAHSSSRACAVSASVPSAHR
jgi:hypothetical protein